MFLKVVLSLINVSYSQSQTVNVLNIVSLDIINGLNDEMHFNYI